MPLLGKAVRHEWALDREFLSVNHGSFGAAPRMVLAAQDDWRRRMEHQPGRFMRAVFPDALRHAADRLGAFVLADGKDIAFVDNATTGCNAVLRSLRLQADGEIVVLSHGYGAVRNTVRHVAERAGARVVEAEVPFPQPQTDAILARIAGALTKRTRLAVVDHITSGSALVLPLRQIVALWTFLDVFEIIQAEADDLAWPRHRQPIRQARERLVRTRRRALGKLGKRLHIGIAGREPRAEIGRSLAIDRQQIDRLITLDDAEPSSALTLERNDFHGPSLPLIAYFERSGRWPGRDYNDGARHDLPARNGSMHHPCNASGAGFRSRK